MSQTDHELIARLNRLTAQWKGMDGNPEAFLKDELLNISGELASVAEELAAALARHKLSAANTIMSMAELFIAQEAKPISKELHSKLIAMPELVPYLNQLQIEPENTNN